jgi:hypothetical protein
MHRSAFRASKREVKQLVRIWDRIGAPAETDHQ